MILLQMENTKIQHLLKLFRFFVLLKSTLLFKKVETQHMDNDSLFLETQLSLDEKKFSNKFCSFTIKLNDPEKIYKNSKDITGVVTLVPKIPMLNIPIQVSILGESYCTLFEEAINSQTFLVKDSFSGSKSFRVHETQQDLMQRKNEVEKCLQSSQFLSQTYSENIKNLIQQTSKQIFLQGKQQLFQKNKQNENPSVNEVQQRRKVLSANQKYEYEFSFFLPTNVPISVNSKIFPGVQLFVGYKIEASFDVDEKFMLCEQDVKANYLKSGRKVSVFAQFQIKRLTQQNDDQTVANKLTFKYFNSEGQIENNEASLTSCVMKCFCPQLWRQRYCYDLYHCELLTSINNLRILHLTARIFLEPDKDRTDVRKIKKGKMYMTNKKSDPEDVEEKPRNKSELTNSKIMPEKQLNLIKINHLKVQFFGEIVGIKKLMIFEKTIQLNRQNYDAVQGELILQLLDSYFSEKNQLFEIRYWFQIEPLPQKGNEIRQQKQSGQTQSHSKNEQSNQFDLTFSKLNAKKESSPSKDKHKDDINQREKGKYNKESTKFNIQKVICEQHFIKI